MYTIIISECDNNVRESCVRHCLWALFIVTNEWFNLQLIDLSLEERVSHGCQKSNEFDFKNMFRDVASKLNNVKMKYASKTQLCECAMHRQ